MNRYAQKRRLMTRVAQSVLHVHIHDREAADAFGCGIADFVLDNWGAVADDYKQDARDEVEVVERVAREFLKELAA